MRWQLDWFCLWTLWSTLALINCKLLVVITDQRKSQHSQSRERISLHCSSSTSVTYSLLIISTICNIWIKLKYFYKTKHTKSHTDGTDGGFSKCWRLLSRVSIISGKSTWRDVDFPQSNPTHIHNIEYCTRSTNISWPCLRCCNFLWLFRSAVKS